MDVSSFTGPAKDPVSKPQFEGRNVNEVQEISDRKGSDTPYQPASSVSLDVRNHPLQLLLRIVIDRLNEAFPHEARHENISGFQDMELSPDSTAKHISLHAFSLYAPFTASRTLNGQSPEPNELLDDYIDGAIRAIESGFDEAQTMLQNLGVLAGEVERDIETTFLLVQGRLKEFQKNSGQLG